MFRVWGVEVVVFFLKKGLMKMVWLVIVVVWILGWVRGLRVVVFWLWMELWVLSMLRKLMEVVCFGGVVDGLVFLGMWEVVL